MKKLLLIFGLFLITINTSSQCVSGDCLNGFGVMKFTDGGTYEGSFKTGLLDGFGYYYYPNGGNYTGEFKKNTIQGTGVKAATDGSSYYGGFEYNKEHGLGIYENKDGAWAYQWENGEAKTQYSQTADANNPANCTGNCVNGYGRVTNEDGSYIQAVYENGIAVFGKISTSTSSYFGNLKNNKAHGYGVLSISTGQYSGYFKDGKKHGKGITVEGSSTKTVGDWVDGVLIDPTNFKINQEDFEKELKELIALTKTEREAKKYTETKFSSYVLEQKFLTIFEMRYDAGIILSDENIKIIFPHKSKNKPTLSETELNEALKKCDFLTYDRYTYNQLGIRISLFSDNASGISLIIYYEADYCISGDCENGFGKKSFEYTYTNEKGESITGNRIYEGDFINGKRDGNGEEVWPNGRHYKGQFKNGWKHGKGTLNWSSGDKYIGDWVDDWRTGQGLFTWGSGDSFEGTFNVNKLVYGNYKWSDGNNFNGSWENNKKVDGLYTWASGSSYEGKWKDDLQDGKGIYYFTDGFKYIGEFKNGEFNGFGIEYDKEGAKFYEGNYLDSNYSGKGIKYYDDGKYVGEFLNNKKNGVGKIFDLNGKLLFEGLFKDDKKVEE